MRVYIMFEVDFFDTAYHVCQEGFIFFGPGHGVLEIISLSETTVDRF